MWYTERIGVKDIASLPQRGIILKLGNIIYGFCEGYIEGGIVVLGDGLDKWHYFKDIIDMKNGGDECAGCADIYSWKSDQGGAL